MKMGDLAFNSKKDLRNWAKEQRNLLSESEYQERSESICNKLWAVLKAHPELKVIHSFLPVLANKEPNIFPFIQKVLQEEKFILGSPISNFKEGTMETFALKWPLELEEKKFGILEPANCTELIASQHLDAIICPSYVIDISNHRLGYGGGFYDRYLAKCKPSILKIGISILPPFINEIPEKLSTDIPMDITIHP